MLLSRLPENEAETLLARELAQQGFLTRELTILEFNAIESQFNSGDEDNLRAEQHEMVESLEAIESDIELPRMYNIAARIALLDHQTEQAEQFLIQAEAIAKRSGLLPEMLTSLILIGGIESSKGNFEVAFDRYRRALQIGKTISEFISDTSDRATYQGRSEIRFLSNEVARLASLTGNGKRTDVTVCPLL